MDQIGIRELRQNLSVHLRRVKRGETLEVTEHGRPVALLSPQPAAALARDRLLATGGLLAGGQRLGDLEPLPADDSGPTLSQALAEGRAERVRLDR